MNNSALTLTAITKIYQQAESSLTVLNSLNLEVRVGEVVALVGQSGSGKTTLLQIAGLLDNPTSGGVKINGEDLSSAGDKKRTFTRQKNIGFIYQFHHLLPEFTALENVVLPQMIAGVSRAAAEEKASILLGQLGLADRLNHRPAKLSGGEQQRVAVARAMANNPTLVLADEPTGNLDPKTAENVFSMFMKLAKDSGQSALVATHNMELAKRMDRIVHLEGGVLK
ncbi:MAG: ABC transporter ATP-binding protein [Pseudomonadota bacterium]